MEEIYRTIHENQEDTVYDVQRNQSNGMQYYTVGWHLFDA